MLLDHNDKVEALRELGLTLSQAKVYLASVRLGRTRAKDLWKESGVPRPEVYPILSELFEMGLIEKEISSPLQFKAIPLSRGVEILLGRKWEEFSNINLKAKILVNENGKIKETKEIESQFSVLQIKHIMANRGGESYRNARKTIDYFSPFERLVSALSCDLKVYVDAVRRGVRMRVITEKLNIHDYDLLRKEAAELFSQKDFIVKTIDPFDSNVAFSIIDKKEAYFPLDPKKSLFADQSLWTNNAALIALAEDHFKSNWTRAINLSQLQ